MNFVYSLTRIVQFPLTIPPQKVFWYENSYLIPEVQVWFSWTKTFHDRVGYLLFDITASVAAQSRPIIMKRYSIHNSADGHTAHSYTLQIHSIICVLVATFNCFCVVINYTSIFQNWQLKTTNWLLVGCKIYGSNIFWWPNNSQIDWEIKSYLLTRIVWVLHLITFFCSIFESEL